MPEVNDIVTGASLKSAYDAYFASVLVDYLHPQSRAKGERQKYGIAKPLPSKEEYMAMLSKRYSTTVESLVDDGYSAIEELRDEMQECYDNMPESLQGGDIGQRRQEAADALDNIAGNRPDVPEQVAGETLVFLPALDQESRAKRAANAADMLSSAAGAIREWIDAEPEKKEGESVTEDEPESREDIANECADTLENDAEELSSVEFPGMYG
jgi:hypothetical protein